MMLQSSFVDVLFISLNSMLFLYAKRDLRIFYITIDGSMKLEWLRPMQSNSHTKFSVRFSSVAEVNGTNRSSASA